ncbi:UDP-2,3-diacylglucosamine diphosphatase [Hydrogenovibrio sp. JE_KL2]|uniref:UDP-2,3-diacylglucosamine diphosphatase n=1 Tax=Hydrogenovibrio sp. JE_KL2 TaxID=2651188 RepID=UPI00128B603C|nr:UDP-2,3-diacylglucosamine diphosphatase [Hydrogenovibrio sp. JE_KL2]MPQ75775.1 UDP-2,3-diacylglucosamine diphosphatase [Hydrogenovibrio sp. JE_KL2]
MPFSLITADIHLQPDETHPINKTFYRFLQEDAPQAEALYLIGDIFEMWVGDDVGLETFPKAIQQLSDLVKKGTRVYLIFGNRDFLMKSAFWKATGIQSLSDPNLVDFYGEKILLSHGDSLCIDDKEYQKMRRWFRNPIIQWLFLRLPKAKRLAIGENMRKKSQQYNQNKAENIMDVNQGAVESLMARYPECNHLIHGHTHRPGEQTFMVEGAEKHRWTLGDWRPETQLLKITERPGQSPDIEWLFLNGN